MTEVSIPAPRVVIAGASGFVGMDLIRRLSQTHQIIALTRSQQASTKLPEHKNPGIYWMQCNLFSLRQTEAALVQSDFAFFLVHSMMPAARLTQGHYDDLDLMIADNFSRAAAVAGTKRIVYLGGIQPQSGFISEHLRSRLEVEDVLRSRDANMVALRAGLILGPGGSSSLILVRLVKRLPVLICPPWTSKLSSPVALRDAVSALVACLDLDKIKPAAYDIDGPELISYLELMIRAADEMNVRRVFLKFPLFSTTLSRLWVSLITGNSRELVAPLIQSLLNDMHPGKTAPVFPWGSVRVPLMSALHQAEMPRMRIEIANGTVAPIANSPSHDSVVSIQRLSLPKNWTSLDVAKEYAQWLPKVLRPFLRLDVSSDGTLLHFKFIGLRRPLLELQFVESRSDSQRTLLLVVGGLLSSTKSSPLSRLEFRVIPHQQVVLAAVLDFTPALPWALYASTQAQAHKLIMSLFGRRLRKISQSL